jgi:hypothetical protein
MSLAEDISRNKILKDGLDFVISLSEGDGTIKEDTIAASITITRGGKTENTVILDEEAMSALNSSTWEYNWAPTSGEALVGRYIVEIEIEETGGDFIRIYDEFTIISSTNNSVYLNIPSNGNILKGNKNVSWDNSQRPGTINIQSNLYS